MESGKRTRKGFTFFLNWEEVLATISPEKRVRLYDAIVKYGLRQEDTDFSDIPEIKPVWMLIRNELDLGWKKSLGGQNSHGGGAPVGNQNARKPDLPFLGNETAQQF